MLFILTGDIQIGKTRWLTSLTDEMGAVDIPCAGVLAPGVWSESVAADGDGVRREKIGIDNVLLPEGERVPFALRRDLLGGDAAPTTQSEEARLAWAISDDAIERINGHFKRLASSAFDDSADSCCTTGSDRPDDVIHDGHMSIPGLLVIDELGRLELVHDRGLDAAVRLLEQGPTPKWPHALIVVRDRLADTAEERFTPAWGEVVRISPGNEARTALFSAFGR